MTDKELEEKILSWLSQKEYTRSALLHRLGGTANAAKLTVILDKLAAESKISCRPTSDRTHGMTWGLYSHPKQMKERETLTQAERNVEEMRVQFVTPADIDAARTRWRNRFDMLAVQCDPDQFEFAVLKAIRRLEERPRQPGVHRPWTHSTGSF